MELDELAWELIPLYRLCLPSLICESSDPAINRLHSQGLQENCVSACYIYPFCEFDRLRSACR